MRLGLIFSCSPKEEQRRDKQAGRNYQQGCGQMLLRWIYSQEFCHARDRSCVAPGQRIRELAYTETRDDISADMDHYDVKGHRRGPNRRWNATHQNRMEGRIVDEQEHYGKKDRWQKEHRPVSN